MPNPPLTAYPGTARHVRDLVRSAVIDHDAFQAYIKPCELQTCRATCCHDGVSLSEEERIGIEDLVLSHPASFGDILHDREPSGLFEDHSSGGSKTATRLATQDQLATDYPDHFPKTRCVFLDERDHCALQRFSMKRDLPQWFHKPLTCWLHPILIHQANRDSRPVITLPGPDNDPQTTPNYRGFASCTHCGRPDQTGSPAHQALEPELKMLGAISDRNLLGELRAPALD